jgi:hypothetical protein
MSFSEEGGRPDKLPIAESQKSQADLQHNELIEAIAENDESLMDLYFEKGHLDEDEMVEGLKKAMLKRQIFPCFASRPKGTWDRAASWDSLTTCFRIRWKPIPIRMKTATTLLVDTGTETARIPFQNHFRGACG